MTCDYFLTNQKPVFCFIHRHFNQNYHTSLSHAASKTLHHVRNPIPVWWNTVVNIRNPCIVEHGDEKVKQMAVHRGLFQCQDQHRDNSCDVDQNSASGACDNKDKVRKEQEVQDGRCGASD